MSTEMYNFYVLGMGLGRFCLVKKKRAVTIQNRENELKI